jgi:hypothetical protein
MWFKHRSRYPDAERKPFWQSLPFLLLTSAAAACVVLVNLFTANYSWRRPIPSPFEHPADAAQAVYWNAWASAKSDEFSPARTFAAETDCKAYLDLAAFNYSTIHPEVVSKTPGSEFSRTLHTWLTDSKKHTQKIRVLFLPDRRFFDKPDNGGVVEMEVDLDAIRKLFGTSDTSLQISTDLGKPTTDWLLGRASINLHTHKLLGATSIGISIWDGIRPVDEMFIPVCVGSQTDCQRIPPPISISLKGLDTLRLADQRSSDPNTFPDGALHFLQLGDGIVIGVFHRKDWTNDRFISWRLQDSAANLKTWIRDDLIPAFGVNRQSSELTERGLDLYDKLFPDNEEGHDARVTFQQFFQEKRYGDGTGVPASLFVRMLPQSDDPISILPLGLMAIGEKGHGPDFLGLQFRVEAPLQNQDYRPATTCVSNWVMLVPPHDAEFSEIRTRIGSRLRTWENTRLVFDNIPKFRAWARTSDQNAESTVLATLSHHDRDRLYFSSESIMSTGFHREFANPSIAILDGCGTGNLGAANIVVALNNHGVAAIVATSTEISLSLGADFLTTLDEIISARQEQNPSLEIVMFRTLRSLSKKSPSESSPPYGAAVLAYALLGNGNIQICPSKGNVP